jgi:hypothetical protein
MTGSDLRIAAYGFLLAIICVSPLQAQTTATWTDPAGGNWDDPANWDTVAFPNNDGTTYNAVIDLTGSPYEITLNASLITLDNLTLDSTDATLLIDGGDDLAILNNATITNGTLQLINGVLDGGTYSFGAGGALTFSSSSGNVIRNGAVINSNLVLSDTERVRFQTGANFSGATATLEGTGTIVLGYEDTVTLTGKTFNLNSPSSTFSVDGDHTVTLASDTTLQGRGNITNYFSTGTQSLVNEGAISHQ